MFMQAYTGTNRSLPTPGHSRGCCLFSQYGLFQHMDISTGAMCAQANTGAGALAANAVGAVGGAGGGAVGGGIPARGRRLAQHDGKDGKDKGSSPPPSVSSGGSGKCMSAVHSPLFLQCGLQASMQGQLGAHILPFPAVAAVSIQVHHFCSTTYKETRPLQTDN